jgi:hypothetical protein
MLPRLHLLKLILEMKMGQLLILKNALVLLLLRQAKILLLTIQLLVNLQFIIKLLAQPLGNMVYQLTLHLLLVLEKLKFLMLP